MNNRGQRIYSGFVGVLKNYISNYTTVSDLKGRSAVKDNGASGIRAPGAIWAAKGIAAGAFGFVLSLGECAFGSYPFGLALLCAAGGYAPFIYAGLITAALFIKGMSVPMFLTWSFAFLLRIAMGLWKAKRDELDGDNTAGYAGGADGENAASDNAAGGQALTSVISGTMFKESMLLRAACALGAGTLIAVYRVVSGGFLYYDAFGGLVDMLLTPILTCLYYFALEAKTRYSQKFEIGSFAFMFSFVYVLRDMTFFGFSLSNAAAFVITLCVAATGGLLRGGIAGLACGIACDISYAPMYGLAGLAAGFLWKLGSAAAVAGSVIVGIACGVCADGFNSLVSFAPDLLGGALVFTPIARFGLLTKLTIYGNAVKIPNQTECEANVALQSREAVTLRLEAMSHSFKSLSEVFYTLSDRLRRPGIADVGRICDAAFSGYCKKCVSYNICRGNEPTTGSDAIEKLTRTLYRDGHIERGDVPEYLSQRCACLDVILNQINVSHAQLLEDTLGRDKTEVLAADYSVLSKLLDEAVTDNEREYSFDGEVCKRLQSAARYIGFYANNIAAYGTRRKSIIAGGVDLTRTRLSADDIIRAFETACGATLTPPAYSFDGDYVTMTMESGRNFTVTQAKASVSKENETICGDSVAAFENKEDYFYALLSDGMGSGREAALASRVTSIIVEKMLEAGNSKSAALQLASSFIRAKNVNSETFATIDLLEIDLLNGEAVFVKGGAAPSFILRDGRLFKIASNSMPIGITREITAEEIKTALEDGDIVIMISDGVAQSFEETIMLANMLTYDIDENQPLEAMAERILDHAKSSIKRSDDASVAVIKICAMDSA